MKHTENAPTHRGGGDVLEDDVGAADVDHVGARAHDQTPLAEALPVPLPQRGLQPRVLRGRGHQHG